MAGTLRQTALSHGASRYLMTPLFCAVAIKADALRRNLLRSILRGTHVLVVDDDRAHLVNEMNRLLGRTG